MSSRLYCDTQCFTLTQYKYVCYTYGTFCVATPIQAVNMLYVRLLEPWLPVTCRRGLSSGARAVPSSVRLHRSLLLLGVSQHSEPQQVKEAYLRLAKVYHPDSGSPQASHQKFIQVSQADLRRIDNSWARILTQELIAIHPVLHYCILCADQRGVRGVHESPGERGSL